MLRHINWNPDFLNKGSDNKDFKINERFSYLPPCGT